MLIHFESVIKPGVMRGAVAVAAMPVPFPALRRGQCQAAQSGTAAHGAIGQHRLRVKC